MAKANPLNSNVLLMANGIFFCAIKMVSAHMTRVASLFQYVNVSFLNECYQSNGFELLCRINAHREFEDKFYHEGVIIRHLCTFTVLGKKGVRLIQVGF